MNPAQRVGPRRGDAVVKTALVGCLLLPDLFCIILAAALIVFPVWALAGEHYGTFTAVSEINTPRSYHTATLLANGKVLIAGGRRTFRDELDSAELYDPAAHKFIPTGKMLSVRAGHTATLLPDGKVLMAGGFQHGEALDSAELYDPVSGTFSATGSMKVPRQRHTATLLPDGRVLITGGASNRTGITPTAELYDPAAKKFVATGNMTVARVLHYATALKGGDVLIVGGERGGGPNFFFFFSGSNFLANADLFDPAQGRFSSVSGSSLGERTWSNGSAVLLANGKVLVAGGLSADGQVIVRDARLYDPVSGQFLPTGSMTSARYRHESTLLSDGRVLVTGGFKTGRWPYTVSASAELYDPESGVFIALPDMTTSRTGHTATLLPDGEVLIAGGNRGSFISIAAAELFHLASPVRRASANIPADRAQPPKP